MPTSPLRRLVAGPRGPAALALALCLLGAPASASASSTATRSWRNLDAEEQQRALLDLVVNDVARGQIYVFVRARDVLVALEDLEKAGIREPGGNRETIDGRVFVLLASLAPDVTYQLDERALSLRLVAAPRLLGLARLDLKRTERQEFTYSRANNAFLNYGVNWRQQGSYQATAEAGLNIKGALATSVFTWDEAHSLVRGTSSVTFDDRAHMRRIVVGDSFVGDRQLGGSMFMGGIRVAREYSIDPYFIQYPMLGLSGAVTSPSTIEVYVDNRLVRQERVPPGQFELSNVPVTSGASRTRLVIRDAFGRQQEVSAPYYLANTVLAKGLQEYEYALGFPRQQVGTSGTDYGRLALLARHRYGFNDVLTAGMRVEARAGLVSAGPGINARLPVGEIEVSAAASRGDATSGTAIGAGYTFASRRVSTGVSVRAYSRGYETLSVAAERDRTRYQVAGFVGTRVVDSLGLNAQLAVSETQGGRRLGRGSLFASGRLIGRAYAYASVGGSSLDGKRGFEGSIGLNVALGARTGLNASTSRGADGSLDSAVELQRSLPVGEGVGYRLRAGAGPGQNLSALLQYQNRFGHFEAGNQTVGGNTAVNFSIAGGLVAIGGSVFATRPVQEGFALVRVPGVPGVRTYLSNQPVGRTNSHGDVLVPSLLPYYANRLRIDDNDVPIDHAVERTEYAVAPPYRGGALVVFPAARVRGIWGTIKVELDQQWVLPEFGDLVVVENGQRFLSPIGRQGEFYLENLGAGAHPATVRYRGLACNISLRVPESTEPVVALGELRCSLRPRERRP